MTPEAALGLAAYIGIVAIVLAFVAAVIIIIFDLGQDFANERNDQRRRRTDIAVLAAYRPTAADVARTEAQLPDFTGRVDRSVS